MRFHKHYYHKDIVSVYSNINDIGRTYQIEQNDIKGTGSWDVSDTITLPKGAYIVIYSAVDKNASGTEILCGSSYNVGGYTNAGTTGLAQYIAIITTASESPIRAFFLASTSANLYISVRALRIA